MLGPFGLPVVAAAYFFGGGAFGGQSTEGDTDYASSGANSDAEAEYNTYVQGIQSQQSHTQQTMDATPGYINYEAGNTYGLNANLPSAQAQGTQPGFSQTETPGTPITTYTQVPGSPPGTYTISTSPTYTENDNAPSGYTAVTGAPYALPGGGASDIVGYNPSGDQGGGGQGLTQLQGYTNETPSGGGDLYAAPQYYAAHTDAYGNKVPAGYVDFGSGYNAQTNPSDYFWYSDYAQALEGGNQARLTDSSGKPTGQLGEVTGLAGTDGTISYGAAPTNQIAATSTVGVESPTQQGATESDPTINGIDYTQGASYAALAAQGIGTQVPGGIGTPESGPHNGFTIPYTQYTEPGYIAPTATAAGPTGTQSYNAQGQAITPAAPTNTPEGFGTAGTFYYGDNGSAGSISGVFSNNTPGQATQFYSNEPGSLTNAPGQSNLGTFAGQSNNAATATPAPTDTAAGYFTYPTSGSPTPSASDNGINQATGDIGGYNPLGLDASTSSTFTNTDSALGYNANNNTVNGITGAVINQSNPGLQALTQSRQTASVGFS